MSNSNIELIICSLLFINVSVLAQPHISGSVELNREKGLFLCEFDLSKLPKVSNYRILLNHGMNIKSIKNSKGEFIIPAGKSNNEAQEYYLSNDSGDTLALPSQLKVSYTGAYPVYQDKKNAFDFKGYIAINDKTIRAAEQTKWYPVLYDVDNDALLDAYTYDIEVTIEDGSSIFLNGSPPVKSQKTRFKSEKAVPLFLFAGSFDFIDVDGDYIINANVTTNMAQKILANVAKIKKAYKNMMDEEFNDNIYLINHDPVKEMGPNQKWGFNIYPALAFAGYDFSQLLYNEERFHQSIMGMFAHEMGHNYFGLNARSGTLLWFWVESVAEYMSILALDELSNEGHIKWVLERKIESVKDKDFVPLIEVKDVEEIDEVYRYNMGPLILKVFEGEFGKDKIVKVLKSLYVKLETDGMLTLSSLEQAALENGINQDDYANFSHSYLESENFEKNVTDYVNEVIATN